MPPRGGGRARGIEGGREGEGWGEGRESARERGRGRDAAPAIALHCTALYRLGWAVAVPAAPPPASPHASRLSPPTPAPARPRVKSLEPAGLARQQGMRVGDVLLSINGQRTVGHAEATQLLRSTRGDLRIEISRSQLPIAATTLQRYWRGLGARRATAARRDAARRGARPAPTWPPQEVVTANQALLSAAVDRATSHTATEHVLSFRKQRREATGYARSRAWRENEEQARRAQPCRRLLCPPRPPRPPPARPPALPLPPC